MRKHRNFLKTVLLLTTITAAVPSVCYGAEETEVDGFYQRGQHLLSMDLNLQAQGSFLKHQAISIAVQDTIRKVEAWQHGAMRDQIEQAQADVAKYQDLVDRMAPVKKLTRAERAQKEQQLREQIEDTTAALRALEMDTQDQYTLAEITKNQKELIEMQSEVDLLKNYATPKYARELDRARAALEALEQADVQAGETPKVKFLTLIYTKLKTTKQINGLDTTGPDFIRKMTKYKGYIDYEEGTTVSPHQDMIRLLHDIGIGQGLVNGLVTTGPEVLDLEKFLTKLLTAIEVPDPRFEAIDLPNSYYMRVGGQYLLKTDPVEERLWAYAAMADHIAHVFDLRLREDVASLKSIVDAKEQFQLTEDPDSVLSEVWNGQLTDIGALWGVKDTTAQQIFRDIVQTYDSNFTIDDAYLDAAVPPNSLGVLYRLLKATGKDIHSWNPSDEPDLDAKIKARDDIARDFEDAVERIISRHYNKILLEKMADNVRGVAPQPRHTQRPQASTATALTAPSARVITVAPPPVPVVVHAPVVQYDDCFAD